MLGKRTRGRRKIELIDDLLEKKNYTDLKKPAEDRSVWRTREETVINLLHKQITGNRHYKQ